MKEAPNYWSSCHLSENLWKTFILCFVNVQLTMFYISALNLTQKKKKFDNFYDIFGFDFIDHCLRSILNWPNLLLILSSSLEGEGIS